MSVLFWINAIIAVASVANAWLDHGETRAAFKASTGPESRRKLAKLLLLWGLPILALAGLPFTALESEVADRGIKAAQISAANAIAEVAQIDPGQQRVHSVSAIAKFQIRSTATNTAWNNRNTEGLGKAAFLLFHRAGEPTIATICLSADSFERWDNTAYLEFKWFAPAGQFLFCKLVEHQTEGGFWFSMLR